MKKLYTMLAAMLGFLSLQFILGMISNLYVTFPDTTDQKTLMDASWKHWATASHIILGVIIVLLAFWILVLGVRAKVRIISAMSIVGFLAILVAAVGGDRFVRTQHDVWSLIMAIGFIVAMGVYGRLMAMVQEKAKTASTI